MQKILIRHQNGRRDKQVDEFPTAGITELIAGRDPSAKIHFDGDSDDLVSRQHLKIVRDPVDPSAFQVEDLQSRNGTFLNHRRIFGSARVSHGDIIQLGPGGPEFSFELDPPPDVAFRPTREAVGALKPTGERFGSPDRGLAINFGSSRPVGKGTVEIMLDDAFGRVKGESRKTAWIGLAALIAILGVGLTVWMALRQAEVRRSAAEAASQAQLNQVNEELAKNPAQIEAMRREIQFLQDDLKIAQRQNATALNRLSKQIQTSQAEVKETPRPMPPPRVADDAEFVSLKKQADQLISDNKFSEAVEVSRTLMKLSADRYEGFAFGGISLYFLNRFKEAAALLEEASAKAPADQKDRLQNLARQCRQMIAEGK